MLKSFNDLVRVTRNSLFGDLNEPIFISSETVTHMMEDDEQDRSIDDYLVLVYLLNMIESITEVKRIEYFCNEYPTDLNFKIKLGIIRRKLFDTCNFNPRVMKEYLRGKETAEEFFQDAIDMDETNVHVLYNLCNYHLMKKNREEFKRYLGMLEKHHPNTPWTLVTYGVSKFSEKKYQEGIDFYKENIEVLSRNKSTLSSCLGRIVRGYQHLKNQKKYVESLHVFNEKVGKRSFWGLKQLGVYYYKKREKNEKTREKYLQMARTIWTKALKTTTHGMYYLLAHTYKHNEEDLPKALEAINNSLRYDPCSVNALLFRIGLLGKLKRYDEAIRDSETLVTFCPNGSSFMKKAHLHEKISPKKGKKAARKVLEEAVKVIPKTDPKLYQVYHDLSSYNLETGHRNRALESINLCIDCKPDRLKSIFKRAKIYMAMNKHRDALEDFEFCRKHDFLHHGEVFRQMAIIYYQHLRDQTKALENFKLLKSTLIDEFIESRNNFEESSKRKKAKEKIEEYMQNSPAPEEMIYAEGSIANCYFMMKDFGGCYRRFLRILSYEKDPRLYTSKDTTEEKKQQYRDYYLRIRERRRDLVQEHGVVHLMRGKGRRQRREDLKERLDYFYDRSEDEYPMLDMVLIFKPGGERVVLRCFEFLTKYQIFL